jgi:hypothetical protein
MSLFGNSRYIAKEDVGNGSVLTIKGFTQENVAKKEEAPDVKYVMRFHETDKGLVMKPVIAQLLIRAFGLKEEGQVLTHLINQQVTLYNDANVQMAGRFVGGTRVRLPQQGDVPFAEVSAAPAGPAQFTPDPRQTPPSHAYQQAQQHAPRPPVPAHQPPPAAPRPPAPVYQAPRPPAPAYAPPAPQPYTAPAAPAEDAPWPGDGQM